jgi:hypothetical protein
MAIDWLKIEKDTPEKPELLALVAHLGVSHGDAFLACFRAWRWADSHTVDGLIPRVTLEQLDALVNLQGFSQALVEVGWLQVRQGHLQIPNFNLHMGHSAKKRALDAQRKSVRRMSASEADKSGTREEKRREEKNKEEKGMGAHPPTKTKFIPPTVEEVAAYCKEAKITVDPSRFVDYYTANGWMAGKAKMKDWHATLRNWERTQFNSKATVQKPDIYDGLRQFASRGDADGTS